MNAAIVTRILLCLFAAGMGSCVLQQQAHHRRLRQLLHVEHRNMNTMESHVLRRTHNFNQLLRRFSLLISTISHKVAREDYLETPIRALVMIRRLAEDWTSLAAIVGELSAVSRLGLGSVRWPTAEDVSAAALTVKRTQFTYDLNINLLAQGSLTTSNAISTNVTDVTAADCFSIATVYHKHGFFDESVKWLRQAVKKLSYGDSSASHQAVLQYLAPGLCTLGNARDAQKTLLQLLVHHPRSELPHNLEMNYKDMRNFDCRELFDNSQGTYENLNQEDFEIQKPLCRGDVKVDRRLRCRYVHYQKQHLKFQPFKVEELQFDPPVLRFVEVISDSEADALKKQAVSKMKAALVTAYGSTGVTSNYRTSKVAWLDTKQPELNARVTKRMGEMTQLNVETAEKNQLARYSISGEFLHHVDFLKLSPLQEPFLTDRIATLMFYLNDVKQGGNTVFMNWGLSVPPVKNSAVLWFNFLPNGDVDKNSAHSGCPVLQGQKWVLNKWFRNVGHEFRMPCGLRKNSSFKEYYYM